MYEITYDYEDEKNIRENFEGDWTELQEYIAKMKENGCYNIDATSLDQGFDAEECCSDEEEAAMERNNEYEINNKLFADFTHAISMRNIRVEDLVNNVVGQELRAGRELPSELFEQLTSAAHALKRDGEALAGMLDKMNHWSFELTKAVNAAIQLEKEHQAEADGPSMQM